MSNEELNIVYEDNHLLVVVKPNNIPVMADSSKDLDLLSMLKNYLVKKYDKPGEAFLGLVHRLDRPTGGIMVFAKTSKCAKRLQEQIQNGDMEKSYLAVLDGVPKEPAGKLVNYLKKNEKTNEVRVVPSAT
ncbi:MAG: pseudouridine synthase, partial [Clostridia bacterium]|nr:pseudouridine synthase [Clostridia bacterium]